MAGYIQIKRDFFKSDLYRLSKYQQREVFMALILRANYESQIIDFGGKRMILELGQIWFSRKGIVSKLRYADVKDSHVRHAVAKMVKKGLITLIVSSRNGGSIYQCTSKFYDEICEPFDLNKQPQQTANKQPTNSQQTANKQPTNSQQNSLNINELDDITANKQPTNSQQTANKQPTNSLIKHNNTIKQEHNKVKEPQIEIDFKNLNEIQKAVPALAFIGNYKKQFPMYAVNFEKDIEAAKKICGKLKGLLQEKKKASGETSFLVKNKEINGFGAKFCEKLHLSDFYAGSELTTLERNFNSAYAEIRRKYAKIKPIKTKYHPIMGEIPINQSKNQYGKVQN